MGRVKDDQINLLIIFKYLIVLALIFGPFTDFRIGKIGVSEVATLTLVLLVIMQDPKMDLWDSKHFVFSRFVFFWILMSLFGLVFNVIVLDFVSGTMNSVVFNLLSNVIVFLTCFALELLFYNYKIDINQLLATAFYWQSIIFIILYGLSQVTDQLGPFNLIVEGVFQPISANLHHGAMSILPLPFIGLEMVLKQDKLWLKLLTFLLVLSQVYISLDMESGSVLLGLAIGFGSLTVLLILQLFDSIGIKLKILTLMGAVGVIAVTLARDTFFPFLIKVFEEEDGGGARTHLWSVVIGKIIRNPFMGYGPGAHGPGNSSGGYQDAHQSILTVGVQSGILPMLLYIRLLIRILIQLFTSPFAFAAILSIYGYIVTTDINRRLPMWIIMILMYYRALNQEGEEATGKKLLGGEEE